MTAVVFYFQVHQPFRLRRYKQYDLDGERNYFDDAENGRIVRRVADRCYLPMNALIQRLIEETEGRFRCAFGLSGAALDQLERWAPDAIESFVDLAETGNVEFVCETAYHSLASQGETTEFVSQVRMHRERLTTLFGSEPVTFRNTELIFDNSIARTIEELGFEVLLGEGADRLLGGRSPRVAYRPKGCRKLKLLLRDYWFSDDIAFRFSNREWECYPLMADTLAEWLRRSLREDDQLVGLFMDYETFGEHQGVDTGIFDFMRHLPWYLLEDTRLEFQTPAAAARGIEPKEELDAPDPVSWADEERDLSAWLGNTMQRAAHEALYRLAGDVRRASVQDAELLEVWRKLTTSDHFYYMCTKHRSDGDVHEYFSPYRTPHDSFVVFMNVLDDLAERVRDVLEGNGASAGKKKKKKTKTKKTRKDRS